MQAGEGLLVAASALPSMNPWRQRQRASGLFRRNSLLSFVEALLQKMSVAILGTRVGNVTEEGLVVGNTCEPPEANSTADRMPNHGSSSILECKTSPRVQLPARRGWAGGANGPKLI